MNELKKVIVAANLSGKIERALVSVLEGLKSDTMKIEEAEFLTPVLLSDITEGEKAIYGVKIDLSANIVGTDSVNDLTGVLPVGFEVVNLTGRLFNNPALGSESIDGWVKESMVVTIPLGGLTNGVAHLIYKA